MQRNPTSGEFETRKGDLDSTSGSPFGLWSVGGATSDNARTRSTRPRGSSGGPEASNAPPRTKPVAPNPGPQ
jgi:hypothetical protein